MAETIALDIYFDYLCPFVYRANAWLEKVKEGMGAGLSIRWRYFSLEQVNSQQGPEWKLWEQPDDFRSRGLWAFRAAEAARCQGEALFERFHTALLGARHQQGKDISDQEVLMGVASAVGLELSRFREDLARRELLGRLAEDHTTAVEQFGVFGTPTITFPGGQATFLKLAELPPDEEALAVFHELLKLATARTYILEVKRPQRPERA